MPCFVLDLRVLWAKALRPRAVIDRFDAIVALQSDLLHRHDSIAKELRQDIVHCGYNRPLRIHFPTRSGLTARLCIEFEPGGCVRRASHCSIWSLEIWLSIFNQCNCYSQCLHSHHVQLNVCDSPRREAGPAQNVAEASLPALRRNSNQDRQRRMAKQHILAIRPWQSKRRLHEVH